MKLIYIYPRSLSNRPHNALVSQLKLVPGFWACLISPPPQLHTSLVSTDIAFFKRQNIANQKKLRKI